MLNFRKGFAFAVFIVATFTAAQPPPIKVLLWQPTTLQQGSAAFFTVKLAQVPVSLTAKWIDKDLTFFESNNPRIWYALAGDDLETPPGTYDMTLTATMPDGEVTHFSKAIHISTANFKSGVVTVPQHFVELDAAAKIQIAADQALKKDAFSQLIAKPQWSGSFIAPVNAKPTASFGTRRIFNHKQASIHRGTDFPVREGSPIVASNSGTIVLAKPLFYEGNCVVIDHGQQLFTIYMHLSRIDVTAGQSIQKGALLGLSGHTGRAAGPHLHMAVQWNGAYLDPTKLLKLTLPHLRKE